MLIYLGTLIGFVSLVFIQPHYLTPEELGLTRLVLSFGSVLSILFSLGISAVTVRYVPKVFNEQNGHHGFFGFLLLYTAAGITAGTVLFYFCRGQLIRFYGADATLFNDHLGSVLLLTIILSFVLGFNAYCIALMRTTVTTIMNDLVVRLLFIAVIFVHFWGFLSLDGYLLAFCGVYAVQALVLLFYIFRIDRPGLIPDLPHMRKTIGLRPIVRYGIIITLTALNSVTLKYIDSIFVGRISLEAVGIYSVAAFLGLAIEIPLGALERIANSRVSHAMASGHLGEVKTIYHDSARFLLLLGGWLFLMVALNAPDLFSFLPASYAEGVRVTQVIAVGALINMATGVNYPILVNSSKYIWGSIFLIVLFTLTVLGNLFLIPHYGMLGAAITACIASVVYNSLKFGFIRKHFAMQPFDANTGKLVLIIAALLLLGSLLSIDTAPWLAIVIRSLVVSGAFIGVVLAWGTSVDLYHYAPPAWKQRFPWLDRPKPVR